MQRQDVQNQKIRINHQTANDKLSCINKTWLGKKKHTETNNAVKHGARYALMVPEEQKCNLFKWKLANDKRFKSF